MGEKEARSAVIGAISMALKDPTLQRGFECICKELADLEKELNYAKSHCLFHSDCPAQKENAELKEKLEVAEKARDYWRDSSFDWRHKCTSRKPFKVAVKAQKQLTKAKEIIKEFVDNVERYSINNEILDRADVFLKSEVEK